jgi:hypothetical protein
MDGCETSGETNGWHTSGNYRITGIASPPPRGGGGGLGLPGYEGNGPPTFWFLSRLCLSRSLVRSLSNLSLLRLSLSSAMINSLSCALILPMYRLVSRDNRCCCTRVIPV